MTDIAPIESGLDLGNVELKAPDFVCSARNIRLFCSAPLHSTQGSADVPAASVDEVVAEVVEVWVQDHLLKNIKKILSLIFCFISLV